MHKIMLQLELSPTDGYKFAVFILKLNSIIREVKIATLNIKKKKIDVQANCREA